jgi:hypothetical protein
MSDPFPPPPPGPLDEALRAHLDAEAAAARDDAERLLAEALARLDADAPTPVAPPVRARRWSRLAVPLGLAAGLLLALIGGWHLSSAQASPAEVLEQARAASDPEEDRCYRVEYQPVAELADRPFLRHLPRQTTLWTRGDGFRVEPAFGAGGVVGRDEHKRVWLAPTPAAGARFDPDELPERFADACEVRTLRLDFLLGELLADFDLSDEDAPGLPKQIRRIRATPRQFHPRLGGAVIEVETKSKQVESLELKRRLAGRDVGMVRFTRQPAEPRPDDFYRLEGALEPGGPVFDRARRLLRRQLIVRYFGELFQNH